MARRRRYIKGRIYITNDKYFSRDGYKKANRRVVAVNNNPEEMHVVKIKSLYDKNGKKRKRLIPIENYPCLTKKSGIYPRVYKKTSWGKPIKAKKMTNTNSRLNKWDMKKISHLTKK